MKSFILVSFILFFASCNNSSVVQNSSNRKEQIEQVREGILFMNEEKLTSEQKELRSKIYQLILDHISIDTITCHFQFIMSKEDFEKTELDICIYDELTKNISDINNYVDSTGTGKEIISSWNQSKKEYLSIKD
ncbi:hypothetical protein [Bacteroides sp. 224]|uniref:hypothetical protein n=1 Tax=Bacteroides sp. 224 TaxID=2302936 RepID=UPI0013D137EB|nr:hypothetical protein [Bacteroides sp. 224]NDV65500.1 hypothetical protein [Bacteroides sp. 224]